MNRVLLSVCGGAMGIAFALAFGRFSSVLMSQFMPTLYGVSRELGVAPSPDGRVLAFSVAITVVTGLLFGAAPARRAARADLISAIKLPVSAGGSRFRFGVDKAMVTLQAALALLLIVGAGLFLRTVANLRAVPLGYQLEGLLYANVEPRTGGFPGAAGCVLRRRGQASRADARRRGRLRRRPSPIGPTVDAQRERLHVFGVPAWFRASGSARDVSGAPIRRAGVLCHDALAARHGP